MVKIFCAIDTPDLDRAQELARMIGPVTGGIKVGLEFFNAYGPQGLEKVREACPEAKLFVDLKYHDIPNTVAGAVRALSSNLEPEYLNVHAAGGRAMMEAALGAVQGKSKLLAVTILTALSERDLQEVGYCHVMKEQVLRMAKLTQQAGLAGIVCSSHEISMVREALGDDFALMVPGIRPHGADLGDQKRVMGPKEALDAGATHLVIGRPITGADNPAKAAQEILESL